MHMGGRTGIKISVIGKTTLLTSLIYGSFCGLCFCVFRDQLPLIFNKNAEVVRLSALLLLFAAVFQISDATQATGAGLLRGIKDVKVPTALITIAYWVIGLPVGGFFCISISHGCSRYVAGSDYWPYPGFCFSRDPLFGNGKKT